jgi:hypothetical protein
MVSNSNRSGSALSSPDVKAGEKTLSSFRSGFIGETATSLSDSAITVKEQSHLVIVDGRVVAVKVKQKA